MKAFLKKLFLPAFTNKEIKALIVQGDIKELQNIVGKNHERFIQIMKLKIKLEKEEKSLGFSFIQIAAQNGQLEIVKFFIENAKKNKEGQQLLYMPFKI